MPRIIGRTLLHYDQVTSTNDIARQRAQFGEAEGLVVTAEQQNAGRGRMGRAWLAPPRSSLQLSVLLRPPLPARRVSGIMQMAALAVSSTLRELLDGSSRSPAPTIALKWPNDVLLNGKKCAGILIESGIEQEILKYSILGIGINVNYSMGDYPELEPFATTLADELGHTVDRDKLQEQLLKNLNDQYLRLCLDRAGEMDIFDEWRSQLATIGQTVRISTPSGTEEGVALDVEGDGALLLRRQGQVIRLYAGEVTSLKDPIKGRFE